MSQPFLLNSRGRMVFPSNFVPELDFSAVADLGHRPLHHSDGNDNGGLWVTPATRAV